MKMQTKKFASVHDFGVLDGISSVKRKRNGEYKQKKFAVTRTFSVLAGK